MRFTLALLQNDLKKEGSSFFDLYLLISHYFLLLGQQIDCHHKPKIKRMKKWKRRENSKWTLLPILPVGEFLMGEVSEACGEGRCHSTPACIVRAFVGGGVQYSC